MKPPYSTTALNAIELFRQSSADYALVVDEFGEVTPIGPEVGGGGPCDNGTDDGVDDADGHGVVHVQTQPRYLYGWWTHHRRKRTP